MEALSHYVYPSLEQESIAERRGMVSGQTGEMEALSH
jgi:hypothetical protein